MRMKDLERNHKKELRIKDDKIKSYYNMINAKNKEIELLSLEHKYNLNNIDIIVKQSAFNYGFVDTNRISVNVQENDKYIEYQQIIKNNVFESISMDKGKLIIEIISNIIQKIFKERGLI